MATVSEQFASEQFDAAIDIVTPENISFQYRVAGPFQRLPAFLIDLCVRLLILLVLSFLGCAFIFATSLTQMQFLADFGLVPILIGHFFLEFFYGAILETYWNGQTVGKRAMRLRVVTIYGQPIRGVQAVLRNVLRMVDTLPFIAFATPAGGILQFLFMGSLGTYQLALLTMMFNNRYQRLGDLVCGTMVIQEESPPLYGMMLLQEPEVMQMAAVLPPGFRPSRGLGLALASYVQRRPGFSLARRYEIARHLGEPLRQKLSLPPNINYDLLLCGLYQKFFIADRPDAAGTNPFAPPPRVF